MTKTVMAATYVVAGVKPRRGYRRGARAIVLRLMRGDRGGERSG
jgi:hypothetical protein